MHRRAAASPHRQRAARSAPPLCTSPRCSSPVCTPTLCAPVCGRRRWCPFVAPAVTARHTPPHPSAVRTARLGCAQSTAPRLPLVPRPSATPAPLCIRVAIHAHRRTHHVELRPLRAAPSPPSYSLSLPSLPSPAFSALVPRRSCVCSPHRFAKDGNGISRSHRFASDGSCVCSAHKRIRLAPPT